MVVRVKPIKADEELIKIINYITAQYLLRNQKPPSVRQITKAIAMKIKKEDLMYDEIVRF